MDHANMITDSQFYFSEVIALFALACTMYWQWRKVEPWEFTTLAPRLAYGGIATIFVIAAIRFIVSGG